MLVFTRRPCGFKLGLLMMVGGLLLYVIGLASSYWTVYEVSYYGGSGDNLSDPFFLETIRGHNGLWQTCGLTVGFSSKTCVAISHEKHPAWVPAVQGMQCMGLVGMIAATGLVLVVNFIKRSPNINNRYLEITLIVSGVFAFIGSTIYAACSNGNDSVLVLEKDYDYSAVSLFYYEDDLHEVVGKNDLSWGYILNLVGWFLVLSSAVLLCANNRLDHGEERQAQESPSNPVGAVSFTASEGSSGGGGWSLSPSPSGWGFQPPKRPLAALRRCD